jgi:hypothetical protein
MDPLMGSGERYEGVTDSGADVSASVGADLAQAAPEGVQSLLGEIVELETFRGQMVRLTLSDRRRIVEQALVLIEQSYVHLPHKVAMHAVNTDQAGCSPVSQDLSAVVSTMTSSPVKRAPRGIGVRAPG